MKIMKIKNIDHSLEIMIVWIFIYVNHFGRIMDWNGLDCISVLLYNGLSALDGLTWINYPSLEPQMEDLVCHETEAFFLGYPRYSALITEWVD